MYLDVRIPVPMVPGLITRQRIRGTVYVSFQYDRVYDKERKINIPRRATIGKLAEDGLMIPNENYRKYFPADFFGR